jgi:hypothetical protein
MFLTETVILFSEYPEEMHESMVREIARRSDRPTLKIIKDVCDEIYAPIARENERRERLLDTPAPPPKRTPEEQAVVDQQVASARRQLGIPADGLLPRGAQRPPFSRGGEDSLRVVSDLNARRDRRKYDVAMSPTVTGVRESPPESPQ